MSCHQHGNTGAEPKSPLDGPVMNWTEALIVAAVGIGIMGVTMAIIKWWVW